MNKSFSFNLNNNCYKYCFVFQDDNPGGMSQKLKKFAIGKKTSKNEELWLSVNDITKSHKVRGTLTYIQEVSKYPHEEII